MEIIAKINSTYTGSIYVTITEQQILEMQLNEIYNHIINLGKSIDNHIEKDGKFWKTIKKVIGVKNE